MKLILFSLLVLSGTARAGDCDEALTKYTQKIEAQIGHLPDHSGDARIVGSKTTSNGAVMKAGATVFRQYSQGTVTYGTNKAKDMQRYRLDDGNNKDVEKYIKYFSDSVGFWPLKFDALDLQIWRPLTDQNFAMTPRNYQMKSVGTPVLENGRDVCEFKFQPLKSDNYKIIGSLFIDAKTGFPIRLQANDIKLSGIVKMIGKIQTFSATETYKSVGAKVMVDSVDANVVTSTSKVDIHFHYDLSMSPNSLNTDDLGTR